MIDELGLPEGESIESIEEKITLLQAKKQGIIDKRRKEVLAETRKNVALYGFTTRELNMDSRDLNEKPAKIVKPITYRNEKINKEWDGELNQKGRKPEWIKNAVENGTIEQYRVKASV